MRLNRRRFLLGAGAAVAIPVLPSLIPRGYAGGDPPRRFLCMYTANGIRPEHFLPSGSETDFTLQGALTSLAPFQDKLILARGLYGPGGHYSGHSEALTGYANLGTDFAPTSGPSVDQVHAASQASETPMPSLEVGVSPWQGSDGIIAWTDSGLGIPPIADPRGAFDRVMAVGAVDPAVAAKRRAQKLSVLDSVIADLQGINGRIAADERRVLDQHLTLLRDQEDRLLNPVEVADCDLGTAPKASGSEFSFPETAAFHAETIAAAFRCDLTRVATMVFQGSQDTTRYDWVGCTDDYHSVAHGAVGNSLEQMLAVSTWHAEQFANLLALLDGIPEDDGTVLDHTLVMWTNEVGLQDWSHSRDDMGVVLAGATDVLRTGRFLDLNGYLYQDLLLTLVQALGHTGVTEFGKEGTQVISELLL